MHANAWATLLRHIPPDEHSKLMLMTGSGMEVAVQIILRIDQEFVAFKGRMAGSQDQGRLFLVPFANIDYINFNYAMKDEEFEAMFGNLDMPATPSPGLPPLAAAPEPAPVAPPVKVAAPEPPPPQPAPEPEPAGGAPNRSPLPLKSAVLERFRSRSGGGSSNGTTLRPPFDG